MVVSDPYSGLGKTCNIVGFENRSALQNSARSHIYDGCPSRPEYYPLLSVGCCCYVCMTLKKTRVGDVTPC
jgi:hypothetical protein